MADDTSATATVDVVKGSEETTRPEDASLPSTGAETAPDAVEGAVAAESVVDDANKSTENTDAVPTGDPAGPAATTGDSPTKNNMDASPAEPVSTNGTPATSKKTPNNRRKSTGGVPEHKKKTPNKKKGALAMHLDIEPGQLWFVTMRGYQPWPVIVCDEEMLPESLISKRPVSAKRIDGTYREDFREGGKNAKDRRYPIMFLGSNEFAWQVNTEFSPLDVEEVKATLAASKPGKKSRQLEEAYRVAAENPGLDYFKEMLKRHEQAMVDDHAAAEAKQEAKKAKQEKQEKRKSKVAAIVGEEDVDMDDAGDATASAKKKSTKKRKKDAESDGENEKPAKTPKTKLKLNNKTPKESASKPKKESKPKKAKAASESEDAESSRAEEPAMTEAEKLEKRKKSVLYLRHRLQKGFLARDQAPKEEEMATMADYFQTLEAYQDLEADIIRETKVHKVLKAIIKLESIPKEEEYQFKKRSTDLLGTWNRALSAAEGETSAAVEAPAVLATNGVKNEGTGEDADANAATATESDALKKTDVDGDVSMADTKEDNPSAPGDEAPKADSGTETAAQPTTEEAT